MRDDEQQIGTTDLDTDHQHIQGPDGGFGGVGKAPVTARLAPRSITTQIFLSVGDVATATALGESLRGGTFVQRDRDGNGVAANAESAVDRASSASGSALPDDVRLKFESCLDTDLSGVRVHTGAESAQATQAVGARAYATGQDIHFAPGQYDPHSTAGQHLLAHEVAHTVQQSGGTVSAGAPQYKLEVSTPGDTHEVEADRAADAMVAGKSAVVSTVDGIQRKIARDFDKDMKDAGDASSDAEQKDMKVQVIMGHTTSADQSEAQAILGKIAAAEAAVTRHPKAQVTGGGLGPMKGILAENVDATFVLQQYLATVSESGDRQSEFAASYVATKKDHGEFMGLSSAFDAGGGKLKEDAGTAKVGSMTNNAEFRDAKQEFKRIRDDLATDASRIKDHQGELETAKNDLTGTIYGARQAASSAKAKSKQAQLDALKASINQMVDTIMTVGQLAASAMTAGLAMGTGGFDISTLVESNPEIAPGDAPAGTAGAPGAAPLAPPDIRKFAAPGTDLNPHGTHSPGGTDTQSFNKPSQAVNTAKGLAEKGVALAGGPKEILQKAITALEQGKLDRLQGEIEAAQEDANLSGAVAAASQMAAKKSAYTSKLQILLSTIENMINHKKQMDNAVKTLVAAAKKQGAGKDVTGAIRLVGAGDKFLSQIDLTISLGEKQQAAGAKAKSDRYNVNDGPFSKGTVQGPGQLHYWTVHHDKDRDDFVATKCMVTLQASGKDSLETGTTGNSTQFDTGKSLEELRQWKVQVKERRDAAEAAIGIGNTAGKS
jgi:hypothetical protein